jgi:hypothetical protein
MKHPPLHLVPVPRGPLDGVWTRLDGQFWVKLALYSTDLPEGPKRATPPLLPAG